MKAKVNIPNRGKSNPPLLNFSTSNRLEEENKRMEQTLKELQEKAQQAFKNSGLSSDDGPRWASASQNLPLRNYGKAVLENKGKGANALNAKPYRDNSSTTVVKPSREKPSREKLPSSREKLPTLSSVTTSTTRESSKSNKENESQKDFFKDALMGTSTNTTNTSVSVNKSGAKSQKQSTISSAENNLAKALLKQKETSEVGKFLDEVGLPQYLQVFHDNGFDDLETIMEIETKHLVDMKIPAGHQIKITKKIEQLNQKTKDLKTTILSNPKVVVQTADDSTTVGINISQIESSRESYYGKKASESIQVAEPAKEKGIGNEKTGGELLQGTFDEAESHKSFLEALNEWRSGKAKAKEPEPEPEPQKREGRSKESRGKKVRFNEPAKKKEEEENEDDGVPYISTKAMRKLEEEKKKKEEKKSFFFSGDNSWNVVQMPEQIESGTEAQKPKVSCWNCYRLIANELDVKHAGSKQFCSVECVKIYIDSNTTKCMKKGCENSFLKEEGIIREGDWFCSEKCALQNLQQGIGDRNGRGLDEKTQSSRREGSDEDEEGFLTFDFENDANDKDILTMAELEEKYKNCS